MNQNQTQSPKRPRPKRKNRGATVAAVLCFVAAIAIVGTYTFKDFKAMKNEQLLAKQEEAKAEKEKEAEPLKETTTDLIINDLQEKVKETNQENANQKQEDSVENGPGRCAVSPDVTDSIRKDKNRKLQQRQQIALAGQRKYPYELQHG